MTGWMIFSCAFEVFGDAGGKFELVEEFELLGLKGELAGGELELDSVGSFACAFLADVGEASVGAI